MSSSVEEYYDDFSVPQSQAGVHRRHIAIFQWLMKFGLKSNDAVLEVGCGVGTVTSLIARFVKRGSILAVDVSGVSIDKARVALAGAEQVTFLKGDIVTLDINRKFDVIVMPDVIEHIPLDVHAGLFRKCAQLLKPSGFVLIHIPEPHHLEWMHTSHRGGLQIIDQPVHAAELEKNLQGSGLQINYLRNYSIWIKGDDYRVIVLRPAQPVGHYLTANEALPAGLGARLFGKIKSFFGAHDRIIPD